MSLLDILLPSLNVVIQGMAKHFGNTSEFVVHNFNSDQALEHTIVSIINGHVTGRTIGDSILRIEMSPQSEADLTGETKDGLYNFFTRTADGRILKSSMIYLRDSASHIIGAVCINSDDTQLEQAKKYIDHYAGITPTSLADGAPASCIDDFLISLIYESVDMVGVPISSMTREQKMSGIKFLKDRGAFKITKASEIIARYYDISKYTVYNYLSEFNCSDTENTDTCQSNQ